MNCVACKKPLIVLELDQVEVDYCLDCGGTWLDAGELELLLGNPEAVKQVLDRTAAEASISPGERRCPICLKRMEEIAVGSKSPVHIDRCRAGHGIWFDRGELDKIAAIMGGPAENRVADLLRDIFGKKKV